MRDSAGGPGVHGADQAIAGVGGAIAGAATPVVDVTRLRGGLTAAMDLVTVAGPDGSQRVVLRRWYIEDATKDGLVDREAAGLEALAGSAVPAPELIAADRDGSATGTRCTLTTALTGTPDLSRPIRGAGVRQLARTQ